jgi:hypothetical protein
VRFGALRLRGHYVPASACRPTSVILSHVTLIGRLPACTVSAVAVAHQAGQHLDHEAMRQHDRLGASERRARQQPECPEPLRAGAAYSKAHRHCAPLRLSRAGCSRQFGTGTSSNHAAALMMASWWHR